MASLGLIGAACLHVLDTPLRAISAENSTKASKIFSGLAIVVLSILSLGVYAYHASSFFAAKKTINLQKQLESAVADGDLAKVKQIFDSHPILKKEGDIFHNIKSESHISLILPLAAEKGKVEMVKLLVESGASLNAYSRGQKTALERALLNGHKKVAEYLLDQGAAVEHFMIYDFVRLRHYDSDVMLKLLQKREDISPKGYVYSLLGQVALHYDEDPEKCKEVMQRLVDKGDRLVQRDQEIPIPQEAKAFIQQIVTH